MTDNIRFLLTMAVGITAISISIFIVIIIAYEIAQERYLAEHNCVLAERIPASNGFGYGANGTGIVIIPAENKIYL